MGTSSHQITQRDVVRWGMAALVCGSLAILAGNLGGAMPPQIMAQLHGTRASGASLGQMQSLLAQTRQQTAELSSQFRAFESRLEFVDRNTTEMTRRVAAVENSVPLLIEALPLDADIDRSVLTAAIGGDPDALRQVEGGLMALSQRPLLVDPELNQPIPPRVADVPDPLDAGTPLEGNAGIDPTTTAAIPEDRALADDLDPARTGIALGSVPDAAAALVLWDELGNSVGPLLLGLEPRLAEDGGESRLVAGPFASNGAATIVCERLERVGSDCEIAPFQGEPLTLAP